MDMSKYKTIGTYKMNNGVELPLLDIPMMSDERWEELSIQNARHNFRKRFGRDALTDQEAIEAQREFINRVMMEHGDE